MMKVTDPALLQQLNSPGDSQQPNPNKAVLDVFDAGRQKVTDPSILAQLNGPQEEVTPSVESDNAQNPSFLGEMGANFQNALHSAKDLATGNYQDIGRSSPTPKTQILADKLFPEGSDGSFMGALSNVRNTIPSDYSGALLEKFGETAEGKALSVMGGLNPVWNAAGTAINRYVNPAVSNATGIAPDNLALAELAGGALGFKGAGKVSDPTVSAIKNAGNALINRQPKAPIPTAAEIRTQSSTMFDQADKLGGTLQPKITDIWINKAASVLPQTPAGKIVRGETPATQLVGRLDTLRGKPLTLAEAQEIDSALGEMAADQVDAKTGHYNAEGFKLLDIQHSLRDSIENASSTDGTGGKAGFDTLVEARKLWAASARMGDVERIMNRAEGRDNPTTIIKNGFSALANNPKRLKGFNSEEIASIKKAAKTGIVTGALRIAGNRLVPIGGGIGGGFGGAALGFGISEAARGLANHLQERRGTNVRAAVAKRTLPPIAPKQAILPRAANASRQLPNVAAGAAMGGNATQRQPLRLTIRPGAQP